MATVIWYSNPTSGNAMNWTDSNQWNQATDGSGTAGNPDSTDDKAIIQSGDTVTLDGNVTTGGCSNAGTLTGNASYSLTLAGNDQDNNYNNSGTVTNLNLIMTGIRASGDRTVIDVGSGIRDFTLNDTTNSGNNVHALGNTLSISGDLTITSGTLNTQSSGTDRGLTVTGRIDIASGATLTCNSSAVSSAGGVTVTGTLNAPDASGSLTISGEYSNRAIDVVGTFNNNDGTITITYAGQSQIRWPSSSNPHSLVINHASADIRLAGNMDTASSREFEGNVTITAGILSTLDVDGSQNHNLTVTGGNLSVSGTLLLNNSTVVVSDTDAVLHCGNSGTVTCANTNLTVNAVSIGQGTFTAPSASGSFIITGENSGLAFDYDGNQFIHNSGTIEIKTAAATKLDLVPTDGSADINNVKINHASCDAFIEGNTSIAGNLEITLGKLTCTTEAGSARTLTVAGRTDIGPSSGSADQATLTATSQDLVLGSGRTSSHALIINQGGTFVGGTGIHTIGSLNIKNSVNAKCTLSSGVTTINGEHGGDNKAINIEGSNGNTNFAHGSGTVIITHDGASDIKADGVTLALNNLTINHASANINLKGILTVAGNLTITAGELDTDSSNYALTVTGAVSGAGTLTGNASEISMGNFAMSGTYSATTHANGTIITDRASVGYQLSCAVADIIHNNGTFDFRGSSEGASSIRLNGASDGTNGLHKVIINASSRTVRISSYALTINGALIITAGTFSTLEGSTHYALTVNGDETDIQAAGTLTGNDSAISLKALTIRDGGTYNGTSGTTTITGEQGGYAWKNDETDGTGFVHNNGIVKITGTDNTHLIETTFYDLTVDANGQNVFLRPSSGTAMTIVNNFTLIAGIVGKNSHTHTLTVTGLCNVGDGSGSANTAHLDTSTSGTATSNFGALTILSDGKYTQSTTTNVGSIRNVGGTIA